MPGYVADNHVDTPNGAPAPQGPCPDDIRPIEIPEPTVQAFSASCTWDSLDNYSSYQVTSALTGNCGEGGVVSVRVVGEIQATDRDIAVSGSIGPHTVELLSESVTRADDTGYLRSGSWWTGSLGDLPVKLLLSRRTTPDRLGEGIPLSATWWELGGPGEVKADPGASTLGTGRLECVSQGPAVNDAALGPDDALQWPDVGNVTGTWQSAGELPVSTAAALCSLLTEGLPQSDAYWNDV
jgi:hypothetical protein